MDFCSQEVVDKPQEVMVYSVCLLKTRTNQVRGYNRGSYNRWFVVWQSVSSVVIS